MWPLCCQLSNNMDIEVGGEVLMDIYCHYCMVRTVLEMMLRSSDLAVPFSVSVWPSRLAGICRGACWFLIMLVLLYISFLWLCEWKEIVIVNFYLNSLVMIPMSDMHLLWYSVLSNNRIEFKSFVLPLLFLLPLRLLTVTWTFISSFSLIIQFHLIKCYCHY